MFKHCLSASARLKFKHSPASFVKCQMLQPISIHKRSLFVSSLFQKSIPYNLADIGEGITECEIIQWYVKVGDTIAQFDKVCEVQSDKATVEITSRFDGVVKELLYDENEIAPVGKPLMMIEVEDAPGQAPEPPTPITTTNSKSASALETAEPIVSALKVGKPKSEILEPAKTPAETGTSAVYFNKDIHSTPAVRFMAKENNVDLVHVVPTGKNNRITKGDILNHLQNTSMSSKALSESVGAAELSVTPIATSPTGSEITKKLTAVQKAMYNSMTSALSIPHFAFSDEVEVSSLISMRDQLNSSLQKVGHYDEGNVSKITFLPFFIKAASLSLLKYPILNAKLVSGSGDSNSDSGTAATPKDPHLVYRNYHNIGVAMDTPSGLLVPNIKNVESKSIMQIAQELAVLQNLARNGQLLVDHMKGGTFTISSVGNIGGTNLSPVIVPSQLCIGAFGKIKRVPAFKTETDPLSGHLIEKVVASNVLIANWCADHRVIDGATLARFASMFKTYLESPVQMLANMK